MSKKDEVKTRKGDDLFGDDWELWRAVAIVLDNYTEEISREIIKQVQLREKCRAKGIGFIGGMKESDYSGIE